MVKLFVTLFFFVSATLAAYSVEYTDGENDLEQERITNVAENIRKCLKIAGFSYLEINLMGDSDELRRDIVEILDALSHRKPFYALRSYSSYIIPDNVSRHIEFSIDLNALEIFLESAKENESPEEFEKLRKQYGLFFFTKKVLEVKKVVIQCVPSVQPMRAAPTPGGVIGSN